MARARFARNERSAALRRSAAETMPDDFAPASHAWLSDRPSWCVDKGEVLEALTTCDLWLALARGEVGPDTRVWREGMPYWDAVKRVPEFALAMPDARVWGTPVPPENNVSASVHTAARADSGVPASGVVEKQRGDDRGTERPPASAKHDTTPAPVEVDSSPERLQTKPHIRTFDRRGLMSVAIGAALAIIALGIATTAPAPSAHSEPPGRPALGAPAAGTDLFASPSKVGEIKPATTEVESTDVHTAAEPAVTVSAAPKGPHASDRGQQRARGGTAKRSHVTPR
ncbi:MAG: DUF4339 domain-containing protein [Polyangiaceae bacterium]|nr:DUF4339 domain-containing protein [Polyangiaceae bacterium]